MSGSIPVLKVEGRSLAETWEKSLLALDEHGCELPTEYDKEGDRPSLDATMVMVVAEPLGEPVIHRAFPGGLEDLEEYRQEVLDGVKDHWVRDPSNPADQRWEYTYHERLFAYTLPGRDEKIDQVAAAVDRLAKAPHSRRAQAITWKVWEDYGCDDPACLQSLWFRVLPDDAGVAHLNMNVRFRSRDAYDAAYMNCFAFVHLQARVARELAEKTGREVKLGRYVDLSDSYHIYGRRRDHFEEGFLKLVAKREFADRTWTLDFARPFFEEARPRIAEKIRRVDEGRKAE